MHSYTHVLTFLYLRTSISLSYSLLALFFFCSVSRPNELRYQSLSPASQSNTAPFFLEKMKKNISNTIQSVPHRSRGGVVSTKWTTHPSLSLHSLATRSQATGRVSRRSVYRGAELYFLFPPIAFDVNAYIHAYRFHATSTASSPLPLSLCISLYRKKKQIWVANLKIQTKKEKEASLLLLGIFIFCIYLGKSELKYKKAKRRYFYVSYFPLFSKKNCFLFSPSPYHYSRFHPLKAINLAEAKESE